MNPPTPEEPVADLTPEQVAKLNRETMMAQRAKKKAAARDKWGEVGIRHRANLRKWLDKK